MTAVVFETPGLLDVRAITIMGAHAKPNSANPIGFFGTGLKYAIAVAVRLGAEPTIWIGRDKFSFSKRVSKFRGSDLETIRMAVLKDGGKRAAYYELPFTTRYGARWEPWMAFRELESNTRDENGRTSIVDADEANREIFGALLAGDKTVVVVEHPDFVEAAEKIDEIFLPRAKRSGVLLEAFEGKSDVAYYRTMRAVDLGKSSVFTYNVLEALELTEDRTIKYGFQLRNVIARWVLTEATAGQVERILKAGDGEWEYGLEFPGRVPPSEAFREVMMNRRKGLPRNAWAYYGSYAAPARSRPERPWRLSEAHPRPWAVEGLAVVDATGDAVFTAPDGYYDDWARTAEAIVERINLIGRFGTKDPPAAAEFAEVVAADVVDKIEIPF